MRVLGRALIAVTVLALLPTWAYGQIINACVATSGALRIITSGECKKNETPLSWNAQGSQGNGALEVVDANGAVLGTLVDALGGVVARTVGTTRVGIWNVRRDVIAKVFVSLVFVSADCTGQALIDVGGDGGYVLRAALYTYGTPASPSATTAVYPGDPIQEHIISSYRDRDPDGTLQPCQTGFEPYPTLAGPAAFIDLSTFTPPFEAR